MADKGAQAATVVDEVHSLSLPEAMALARLRREVGPDQGETAGSLMDELRRLVNGGGRAWIMRRDQLVTGFASVMPAPGLPGLYELDGFVAPAWRRQGQASRFLATIIEQLAGSDVRQLSHPVLATDSPAGRFLLKNGFYVEHEEQRLVLDDWKSLPTADLDPGFSLRTMARGHAIASFRRLYEAAFAGLAWYQPYENDREVARDLEDAADLLFLTDGRQPAGFLWLRWLDLQSVEIEPVGLLPAYRGRGLGRQLMLAGMRRAAQQGARQVQVGVWTTNVVARTLYRRLGFRPLSETIYLAYDL